MNELPFSVYTIDEALNELNKRNNLFTDKKQIYKLAIDKKIKISFELEYPQEFIHMDKSGHEMEESYSKQMGESYLIPKNKSMWGLEYLRAGRFDHDEIYPFVTVFSLKNMLRDKDNKLLLWALNLNATYQGENIKVTPYRLRECPKIDGEVNDKFMNWVLFPPTPEESIHNHQLDRPIDSIIERYLNTGSLFKMDNRGGRGFRVNESQLRITKAELKAFIQGASTDQSPSELIENNNREWELTEKEYMQKKAYELIPLLMKSLGIDPMAYPPQHNKSGLKEKLHTQGKKIFERRFRMKLTSFSGGNNNAWTMAKNNNLIREAQKR